MLLYDDDSTNLWGNSSKETPKSVSPYNPSAQPKQNPYFDLNSKIPNYFGNTPNLQIPNRPRYWNPYDPSQDDWDDDPIPNATTTNWSQGIDWGFRENERRAGGYYTPSYDPVYTPEYETSYSPYQNTSYSPFYDPFQ